MGSVRARLADIVRTQFGVFATHQAEQVQVPRKEILRLRERGEVVRLFRGVYASTMFPDSWELRAMAALLAAGATAALSHLSAAFVLGLPYLSIPSSPELELVVPRGKLRRSLPLTIHESTRIRPIDVVETGPFRVTSPEWTLCSVAFRLGPERFERSLSGIIARGHTTRERMAATAERFDWCTGAPTIRTALRRHLPEGRWTRSQAERWFLRILRDAGLPLPEANVRVRDAAGRLRYLDFAYREPRVCIEIDVDPLHTTTVGRNRDGTRQNDLVLKWTVLRFDEWDLRLHPARVTEQVRRALLAAGADLV